MRATASRTPARHFPVALPHDTDLPCERAADALSERVRVARAASGARFRKGAGVRSGRSGRAAWGNPSRLTCGAPARA